MLCGICISGEGLDHDATVLRMIFVQDLMSIFTGCTLGGHQEGMVREDAEKFWSSELI